MAQVRTRLEDVMKIDLTSVLVDDQTRALKFYTEVLGFVKKTDFPLGEFRWLTVVSPAAPDGVQLVLEPDAHPAAKVYKKALVADGIPATSFGVEDVQAEYERMTKLGVVFRTRPMKAGPTTVAVLDDTCGNLIQLHQI
jgi:catechol 2,3-dioxygenase-like lactoylglutathione lyase family enzyme